MFLSEWREFPSAPCLAGKKKLDDISRLDVVEIARPWHASEFVSFLVGLRTYQHPGRYYSNLAESIQQYHKSINERLSSSNCVTGVQKISKLSTQFTPVEYNKATNKCSAFFSRFCEKLSFNKHRSMQNLNRLNTSDYPSINWSVRAHNKRKSG